VEMKNWLILNYGGVSRIVRDILNDLSRKPKPNPNNNAAKFSFYAYISGAMQRMERLSIEGLQKVSCNPTSLTVVGGSKVRLNH